MIVRRPSDPSRRSWNRAELRAETVRAGAI